MSLRIHTIRGLFWAGVQRTGGQAISLVAFIVLSRLLKPSAFGLLALANAYLLVALLFIEQGVNQSIVQRAELTPDHLDTAFSLSLLLASLLTLLSLVVAGPLARLFREPVLAPVLIGASPSLFLAGLRATQTAILQRQLRFRELAVRTTVAELVGGAFGVGMAWAGAGVWSLVGQVLGRGLAAAIVLWRVSDWKPRPRLEAGALREIGHFGLPILGDRVVNLVQGKADDILIGWVLGTTALGYYSVGYRTLTYLTQLLAGTVQSVALSVLSRLQSDLARFRHAFLTMLEYLALGAFPVFVGIAWVAPDAVPLVFGSQWAPSIPVVQVLALAGAAKTLPLATATALIALGRPEVQFRMNLATSTLSVLGFAVFVGRGILAVAAVHLGVALLVVPLHAVVLRSTVAVPPRAYGRAIRNGGLGILAMSAGLMALGAVRTGEPPSAAWLGLTIVIGTAFYLATVYLSGKSSLVRARAALREGILSNTADPAAESSLETFPGPFV